MFFCHSVYMLLGAVQVCLEAVGVARTGGGVLMQRSMFRVS